MTALNTSGGQSSSSEAPGHGSSGVRRILYVPHRDDEGAIAALLWAGCGGAIILLILTFGGLHSFLTYGRSYLWQVVPCKVQSVGLRYMPGLRGSHTVVTLDYEYEFGGKTYHGDQWRPAGQVIGGNANTDAFKDRLARAVVCYVNPRNPSEAILEQTFPWGLLAAIVVFTVVFVVPGIVLFFRAMKGV